MSSFAAKKAAQRAAADALIRHIIESAAPRADKNGDVAPGSIEQLKRGKSLKDVLFAAGYATWRMDENSQLLDGGLGNMGMAHQFLIDEERFHRHNYLRATDRRMERITKMLEANPDILEKLFSKHEFDFHGFKGTFTVDDLMYIWLSQFNEETRAAVAYGNFLYTREKGTPRVQIETSKDGKRRILTFVADRGVIADDTALKQLGDDRYNAALRMAEEKIREAGLWDLMEEIEADFNNAGNRERLQRAAIDFYNNPIAFVKYYLPIIRRDIRGNDLINDTADSIYNLNTGTKEYGVEKGFTYERIKNINPRFQRQVKLSLMSVWQESVRNQEYLIEYAGYIKKARMIFSNAELADAVNSACGPGLMKEIDSFLNLVANPHALREGNNENINQFVRMARGRLTTGYLAWKASTIVMQAATSAWPFLRNVKKGYIAMAFAQLASQRHSLLDSIYEKSVMMKHRSSDMIMEEAIRRRGDVMQHAAMSRMQRFEDLGMKGIELTDRYIVAAGWYAKYMEEMQAGKDLGLTTEQSEARAVKAADDLVYAVQPSGDPKDLPSLFRNRNEFARAFLQFQSALSVIWNNLLPDNIGFWKTKQWGKLVGGTFAYMMAGLSLGLIADGFDDDDDAKDRIMKILYWMATQPIESIPLVGSELSGMIQYWLTGSRDFYGSGTTLLPAGEKLLSGLNQMVTGDFLEGGKKLAEGAALFTGLPVSGFKQAMKAATGEPEALLGR